MKIAIIGGSNTILKYSYTHKLKQDGYNITNYGIGATNSIYGIIQIIKNDIMNKYDLIIYEYFVNDNNHFLLNINNVCRVEKTLNKITNMCAWSNTKLLFIYIYNKKHQINNKYSSSPMYLLYKTFSKNHDITTINVYELLHSKYSKKWIDYYKDDSHLSDEGMNVLNTEIKEQLKIATVPRIISDHNEFNFLNLIQIGKYFNTVNYTNSLININYLEILVLEKIVLGSKNNC